MIYERVLRYYDILPLSVVAEVGRGGRSIVSSMGRKWARKKKTYTFTQLGYSGKRSLWIIIAWPRARAFKTG